MRFARMIQSVEAHAGGEHGRVIVGGVLDVPGETMFDKMRWLATEGDDLRRLMLREPRGYPAANVNLVLPSNAPRRPGRLRDHGAGRVPGHVRHEHDLHRDRACWRRACCR